MTVADAGGLDALADQLARTGARPDTVTMLLVDAAGALVGRLARTERIAHTFQNRSKIVGGDRVVYGRDPRRNRPAPVAVSRMSPRLAVNGGDCGWAV